MCAHSIAKRTIIQVTPRAWRPGFGILQDMASEEQQLDVGEELVGWETWDKPPMVRSRLWYTITGTVALGLVVYAVLTANYLFAIIVLMLGVTMLVTGLKKPRLVKVAITNLGIAIADEFYPFKEIKDFSIVYNPPEVQNLYIDFVSVIKPMVTIDLGDANPNLVRDILLRFAFENLQREDEHFTDILRRVYKL
jgi:hypothetical protein